MVAFKIISWLVSLALLFTQVLPAPLYGDVLGDRILLNIDGNSFTQRHLEAHILVSESLRRRSSGKKIFSAQNWQQHLQFFRDDMLILAKIEKYQWYPLSDADIGAAMKKSQNNLGVNNSDLVRLGIDPDMLKSLVASNLKIMTYRNNQADVENWLVRLREQSHMRFYTGSSVFQEIHPQ